MILHKTLCILTEEANFDRAKQILISQFGLVAPQIADAERIRKQLVWEDPLGVGRGRYRVNFSRGESSIPIYENGKPVGELPIDSIAASAKILFRYWTDRIDAKTEETDPMRRAYLAVYSTLKPLRVIDAGGRDINLEGL